MKKEDPRFKGIPVDEIRVLFDDLKANDFAFMRSQATREWMGDFSGDPNMPSKAWIIATLSILTLHGYELKKKE